MLRSSKSEEIQPPFRPTVLYREMCPGVPRPTARAPTLPTTTATMCRQISGTITLRAARTKVTAGPLTEGKGAPMSRPGQRLLTVPGPPRRHLQRPPQTRLLTTLRPVVTQPPHPRAPGESARIQQGSQTNPVVRLARQRHAPTKGRAGMTHQRV